jgi:hypothetical protein
LISPVGSTFLYSDISMITLMYVIGARARTLQYVLPSDLDAACAAATSGSAAELQCYYWAYCNKFVLFRADMSDSTFRLPFAAWGRAAPTWNDTQAQSPDLGFRHEVLQGTLTLSVQPHHVT